MFPSALLDLTHPYASMENDLANPFQLLLSVMRKILGYYFCLVTGMRDYEHLALLIRKGSSFSDDLAK